MEGKLMPRFLTALALLVALCSVTSSAAAADVPSGRLPATLQADAFAIELRIDPRKDDFAGVSRIDGALTEPTRTVFVHGRDLHITRATITPKNGESLELKAEQEIGRESGRESVGQDVENSGVDGDKK